MIVINQKKTTIINTDSYSRFSILQDKMNHFQGYVIVALTADGTEPVKLGYYYDNDEAKEVLVEFFEALFRQDDYFRFPEQYSGYDFIGEEDKRRRAEIY